MTNGWPWMGHPESLLRVMEKRMSDEEIVEGRDYYMDGPYLVFTAEYHLRRGYCCASGCRHCPWRETVTDPDTDSASSE